MPKPFESFTSLAVPLLRANIDTDAIIPSREMKRVSKKGLGEGLFATWRYRDGRSLNFEFILNQDQYKGAKILLAGENFGCGSSREHAVWALAEYGFLAIVAPSYGGIFYGNCIQNGILPIRISLEKIQTLAKSTKPLSINLNEQRIESFTFEISMQHKHMLAKGLDSIDLTLNLMPEIERFEQDDKHSRPWVYL